MRKITEIKFTLFCLEGDKKLYLGSTPLIALLH